MKLYSTLLFLFFVSVQLTFGQAMWTKSKTHSRDFSSVAYAENYSTNEADLTILQNKLANAPMEFTGQKGMLFPIPSPSGELINLRIFESPIMEPGLAAKYPHFKTYRGYDENNITTNVRIDYTSRGLRVYGHNKTDVFYLTPLNPNTENTTFLSFYKKDRIFPADLPHKCNVITSDLTRNNSMAPTVMNRGSVGNQLRTLRIAVAATGEYTIQHGNTVEGGLAAIVTAMNRVNFLYEKEIAVRMLLIEDNDQIIYTDEDTDPYTNDDLGDMLRENVVNLNAVIGIDNYDFGHVFGTQGGGLAGLGVVCDPGIKAWGATGLLPAEGEQFVEEYVAHEIGHQFSANHSWNSCSGQQSNVNSRTAYEPGSGSTIMSYAGLCGSDNIKGGSDPYFHHISLLESTELMNFLENSCSVNIETGNNAPVVDAPQSGKAIPIETPFMLTATASDSDGDALTYCWEQYNLGPTSSLGTPRSTAPRFRSWKPVDEPTRVFPRITDLILNLPSSSKEVLPTESGTLDFSITVRDNNPNSGGVAWDYVSIVSTDSAGPFTLIEPNGDDGIEWDTNTEHVVKWDVSNTDQAPVNCETVDILISYNNGIDFFDVVKENTPNDGEARIIVPNIVSTKARIMVRAHDNYFFDFSDRKFIINQGPDVVSTTETLAQQIELFPNPASNNLNIYFESLNGETTLQLLDVQGRVILDNQVAVMDNGSAELNVAAVSNGVYFLKMIVENKVVTKKVVIQR